MPQSAYDALSRLVSQTDALNQVTKYLYDLVDNLLSITDALNRRTVAKPALTSVPNAPISEARWAVSALRICKTDSMRLVCLDAQ